MIVTTLARHAHQNSCAMQARTRARNANPRQKLNSHCPELPFTERKEPHSPHQLSSISPSISKQQHRSHSIGGPGWQHALLHTFSLRQRSQTRFKEHCCVCSAGRWRHCEKNQDAWKAVVMETTVVLSLMQPHVAHVFTLLNSASQNHPSMLISRHAPRHARSIISPPSACRACPGSSPRMRCCSSAAPTAPSRARRSSCAHKST